MLDDYEVSEEELYNHIGIFLENNANLIRSEDQDSDNNGGVGGLDDSRNEQNNNYNQQRTTKQRR